MVTLKWVVIVGIVALVAALAAAMRLAWENAGSKTIVLATAALSGAALLFVVQLFFELQSVTSREYIGVEYTVNHSTASVGQWAYADMIRAVSEIDASNWLRTRDPSAFDRDSKVVASDFAIFSLTSFLARQEFDWQLQRMQFSGEVMPGITLTQPTSKGSESTAIGEAGLRGKLSAAGNVFTDAPLVIASQSLLLPPRSTLEIHAKSLVVQNQVCQITWELQPPFSIAYIDPRTRTVAPTLPSGKQKYETLNQYFIVTVTFYGLHSQRRDISKYKDWVSRLVAGSHRWFEQRGTEILANNGVPQ